MISVLGVSLLFLVSGKQDLFINSILLIEDTSIFLLTLSFFCIFLRVIFLFPSSMRSEKLLFRFLVYAVISSIMVSFISKNVFSFLIMFETIVFPIYIFILNFSKDQDKIRSVLFMVFFNLAGSLPFMFFCSEFIDIKVWSSPLSQLSVRYDCSFWMLSCFCLIFFRKIPIVFFHFWLPKAHSRASGVCSIILAGLVLKLGTFGFLKFGFLFLKRLSGASYYFFSVGTVGGLLFTLFMFRFFDLKILVACSSVLHMSMIFPGLALNQSLSIFSTLLMMVAHGFVSFFLFYVVTLIYEGRQNRRTRINKSDETLCKTIGILFYVTIFLNLGVPPLINFIREIGFCIFLFNYSIYSLVCFGLPLLTTIFFTILVCRFILYGKKSCKNFRKRFLVDLCIFLYMLF